MGSSRASLCASTSCRVATAVNILFIEPIRNLVAGVLAVPALRSARPQASWSRTLPWRATSTAPANSSARARSAAWSASAATASAWVIRCSTRSTALDGLGVASSSTRPSASPPMGSKRMLSTPTRSGP